jgi:hypothetical protein
MQARATLDALDASPRWRSLAPDRARPTALSALASSDAVAEGLARLASAVTRHFPHNVFCDLDRIAAELARAETVHGARASLALADRLVEVHALFGAETTLCFRYVHDFLYGFDWARWVAREPSARASEPPFGDAFLTYSAERARELASLVAQGDRKYGPIPRGTHRNPFAFRRDPDAETALLASLAREGCIPVRAWETSPTNDAWDRPFVRLREDKARALGLWLGSPGGA